MDVAEWHSWIAVKNKIDFNWYIKICAYAWTQAGNERTGSGCSSADFFHTACLSSTTPYSRGVGNWYHAGYTHTTAGYSATPSSNNIC